MKTFKTVICLVLAVMLTFTLFACGKKTVPVIGINQYGEHPSLDNCRNGFLQGLKDAGLTEGKDYTIDYQNAGFDDAVATQIAQNFSANNVAMMCAIATPSAWSLIVLSSDQSCLPV